MRIKPIKDWSDSNREFLLNTSIIVLVEKYINTYTKNQIDNQYRQIIFSLEDSKNIDNMTIGTIRSFCSQRLLTFKYIKEGQGVYDYLLLNKQEFIEYSRRIGLNIEKFDEVDFLLLFKLMFASICQATISDEVFFRENKIKKGIRCRIINANYFKKFEAIIVFYILFALYYPAFYFIGKDMSNFDYLMAIIIFILAFCSILLIQKECNRKDEK